MPHAGTGRTPGRSRGAGLPRNAERPRRADLRHSHRALGKQRAGDPLGPIRGRAGANELRRASHTRVPSDEFERLRELRRRLSIPNRVAVCR